MGSNDSLAACEVHLRSLKGTQADGHLVSRTRTILSQLTVVHIKSLCKKLSVPLLSSRKAALVERLLAYGQVDNFDSGCVSDASVAKTPTYIPANVSRALERLPSLNTVQTWSKDLSVVSMTYGNIYQYLVELRCKSDSDRQRRSFKSMKGFSYLWQKVPSSPVTRNRFNKTFRQICL